MSRHCVIIGAGHGAAQLCASLRQANWEGPITLIGDEPHLPYHRPPLSKTQLDPNGDTALLSIRPGNFYADNSIEVISGCRIESIDQQRKLVRSASREIAYDKLVLCTGSIHRKPPITGIDLEGVYALRTAEEARALREAIRSAKRAIIVGGGFIGLEVAASLQKLGLEVTVLELAPRVLSRVTAPEVSSFFEKLHRHHGVDLCTGIAVTEIRKADEGLTVSASDGRSFRGDFVVLGAGAGANSALAELAGLEVGNGITVNEFNQTSNPDIYALGDCCNQFHPHYQQRLRLESVQNAVEQARTVAAGLTGNPVPHNAVPWFWSDQYEVKFQIVGVSTGYDQVVVRGTPEPGSSFSAWYFKEGSLLAVDAVNDSLAYAVATKLLKARLSPSPDDLLNLDLDPKEILKRTK